jgi:hypothetical protein
MARYRDMAQRLKNPRGLTARETLLSFEQAKEQLDVAMVAAMVYGVQLSIKSLRGYDNTDDALATLRELKKRLMKGDSINDLVGE